MVPRFMKEQRELCNTLLNEQLFEYIREDHHRHRNYTPSHLLTFTPPPPFLSKPTLVIVPKNVLSPWVRSFKRWATPDIQLVVYPLQDSLKGLDTSDISGPLAKPYKAEK